jgi:hypothetical protein
MDQHLLEASSFQSLQAGTDRISPLCATVHDQYPWVGGKRRYHPGALEGRNHDRDGRYFFALQQSFQAPKEHRFTSERLKLLGDFPSRPASRPRGDKDCPSVTAQKRLIIVHS